MLALLPEVQRELQGMVFTHAIAAAPHTLVFTFARHRRLLIGPRCFYLTKRRYPTRRDPLCKQIEEALIGAKLATVKQLNQDRILELQFEGGRRLIAELFGKAPRILLIEPDKQYTPLAKPATSPPNPYTQNSTPHKTPSTSYASSNYNAKPSPKSTKAS